MISPPSRRTIIIAIGASVGIVALGGLVGVLLRGEPEFEEIDTRTPQPGPPTPGADDTAEAPALDGGQNAARVAQGKTGRPGSKQGRVEIDANVPAVVREKNQDLGTTPFSKPFSPGRHRLSIATPDGTSSTEMDLVVRPGETVKRTVKLSPR